MKVCEACENGDHVNCSLSISCECECDPTMAGIYALPDDLDHSFTKILLGKIEFLPHNVFDYTKINFIRADLFTPKAVMLVFKIIGIDAERTRWIGFNQLKKDNNNNIWLANWLLEKLKVDKRNDR